MTRRNLEVLELINVGLSVSEIEKELNISASELSKQLKEIRDKGYNLRSSYFSDGNIIIKTNRTLDINPNNKNFRINVKGKSFKVLFISDLHIGSLSDNPEYLKIVYRYALDHDIHIIINCGDVIENIYPDSNRPLRCDSVMSQINRYLRVYSDMYRENDSYNGIFTLNLYGNHDFKCVSDSGFDIARYIENRRFDIVSLGYGSSSICLKDDKVGLVHEVKGEVNLTGNSIVYRGHSHKSKNSIKDDKVIYVPSLSDFSIGSYEYEPLVCFLESEFQFYDKSISRVNQRQLAIIENKIRLANEDVIVLKKVPKVSNSHKR